MASEAMSGIFFDTSIYIAALRQGNAAILGLRRASLMDDGRSHPVWLSAVVLSELFIGASDRQARRQLMHTEQTFTKVHRMLVPLQRDWSVAGQVLARVGEKYGYAQVGRTRMTNDALIAITAARHGFTVLTKNTTDFEKIAEFWPFRWAVR